MLEVNERFRTAFTPFEHTADNQAAVFDAMQGYWGSRAGSEDELERRVGRPSTSRARMVKEIRPEYTHHRYERVRAEALDLYHSFVSNPVRP